MIDAEINDVLNYESSSVCVIVVLMAAKTCASMQNSWVSLCVFVLVFLLNESSVKKIRRFRKNIKFLSSVANIYGSGMNNPLILHAPHR